MFKETKLERLRESHSFDSSVAKSLSLRQDPEKLNEAIIRENDNDRLIFSKIMEKLKGSENSKRVWKLPVGKYGNMNGNKRVYPKKLWENVRDLQRDLWVGVSGLADHPVEDDDPGEFKNQAIIWHEMDVGDDGIVYGYGTFIGEHGAMAEEILDNGGRVSTSSSGFGDVDPITRIVDPDTFQIERLADLVLNPSQGTYGTRETSTSSSASDFLNDLHKGASINYNGSQMNESQNGQSYILKGKNMNTNTNNAVDAVQAAFLQQNQPQQQPVQQVQPQGQVQGQAQVQGQQFQVQNPAQGQPQVQPQGQAQAAQQPMKALTKVEEKAFRKYVDNFIEDAKNIDNPLARLNECVEILECFEEGICPDLRESLEGQFRREKIRLEKLVEEAVSTEKEYGMDLKKFKKAAERNTAQGLLLKEQITDYKELCNELGKRNAKLREKLEVANKKLQIHSKLSEKKILNGNREIVSTSNKLSSLEEDFNRSERQNERLMEKISKLSRSNKSFEKENDRLSKQLSEAKSLIKELDSQRTKSLRESKSLESDKASLQRKLREQEKEIFDLKNNYKQQSIRFDKLTEEFAAYKEEVNLTYNPTAKMMPRFEERVGKYLNLRENKGVEVEAYWHDQLQKYGESILPFESQIRGAKTLREATNAFLKHRTQIDPDFAVAQPAEYAYRNKEERAVLYEHQGIINPLEEYAKSSVDQKNADFLEKLKSSGLQ